MDEQNKKIIRDIGALTARLSDIRASGKTLVLCQGHFNVIHPGHLRFIEFAKKHGDYLVVAVWPSSRLNPEVRDRFFSEEERLQGVASLSLVDTAFLCGPNPIETVIEAVRPSVYVMGEEFSRQVDAIQNELDLVERLGGRTVFSSGEIRYTSTEFLDKNLIDIKEERFKLLARAVTKQDISFSRIQKYLGAFSRCRILVIGDTIVDQYVACDPAGMSSEAPVLVLNELESKEYVGGAAIVSRHVRALGAECHFISLTGSDPQRNQVIASLDAENVKHTLLEDDSRPTTFKIRYMVAAQKLLRVSRLKDVPLDQKMEDEVIARIEQLAPDLDGIIVSDFGYGVITPRILQHLSGLNSRYPVKLFGDVQSSSQIGNVLKFTNYFCLTPTEKESRIALDDKYSGIEMIGTTLLKQTHSQNLLLTLGPEGFIAFQKTNDDRFFRSQHFPALNPTPVDVVGAGDSLLSAIAIAACAGANIMEASLIGALTASVAVGKMGNIPVSLKEIKEALECLPIG